MPAGDRGAEWEAIEQRIRSLVEAEQVRVTQHAQQEMVEGEIQIDEVLEARRSGRVLESYPEHRRGPCCLVHGLTRSGRERHLVCATARPVLIVITVYEPCPPKWVTATRRRPKP